MNERNKVYLEAIGFLASGIHQRTMKLLDENDNVFVVFAAAVIGLLGWVALFYPLSILIFNISFFLFLKNDIHISTNALVQIITAILIFAASFFVSLIYDKEVIKTTEIVITNPVFEVTSDKNIILQKDNPEIQITYKSETFAYIKNANCSEIKKVKYYNNHKDFSDIYIEFTYKDYCDGKEIK